MCSMYYNISTLTLSVHEAVHGLVLLSATLTLEPVMGKDNKISKTNQPNLMSPGSPDSTQGRTAGPPHHSGA